jgi:hypothetical protein
MAEKEGGLSSSFYMQIALLLSIVASSIVGFTYLGTLIENKIDDKIAPILAKIEDLESDEKENAKWIADNARAIDNVTVSMNKFIEYYNRKHNTEFLRPSDITSESIREYKRQK